MVGLERNIPAKCFAIISTSNFYTIPRVIVNLDYNEARLGILPQLCTQGPIPSPSGPENTSRRHPAPRTVSPMQGSQSGRRSTQLLKHRGSCSGMSFLVINASPPISFARNTIQGQRHRDRRNFPRNRTCSVSMADLGRSKKDPT